MNMGQRRNRRTPNPRRSTRTDRRKNNGLRRRNAGGNTEYNQRLLAYNQTHTMMSHDEIVKRRVTRSISTCKHIPMDREKRAHKVAGYMDTEMQREKHPEQTATTIQDLQEQVQDLQKEVVQQKHIANEGLAGRIRRKL